MSLQNSLFKSENNNSRWINIVPGLLLSVVIAWLGIELSKWIGHELLGFQKSPISGIMMAIIVGMIIGNLIALPAWVKVGIRFSLKFVLRLGIILLGIRLGLGELLQVGVVGFPLIILCVVGAILITHWLGSRLQLSPRLSVLIAVGTSICGASAIVATGPAIDARDEELAYAIANITVFGIVAMFLYPYLAHTIFAGSETEIGLFLGTAIHETAQVAGSGLIYSEVFDAPRTLDVATVTKLVRNIFMILVIPLLAYFYGKGGTSVSDEENSKSVSLFDLFPMFIIGFVLLALFRTVGDARFEAAQTFGIWDVESWGHFVDSVRAAAEILLTIAMAGVGLGTNFQQLRGLGLKPFYVGFGAAVGVGLLSVAGITLLGFLQLPK